MHFGGGWGRPGGGPGGSGGGPHGQFDQEEDDYRHLAGSVLLRLWKYILPYRGHLITAILLMLVASGTGLLGPYLLKVAIDGYVDNRALATVQRFAGLDRVALVYLAIYVLNWLVTYWQTYIVSLAGQNIIYHLRHDLFSHVQTLTLRFFDGIEAGRLMSRVTNDIESLNQLLSSGLVSLVNDFFTILGIMAIMLAMNWRLALITFTILPVMVFVSFHFQDRLRTAYHRVRRRVADVNANLQESISGMKVTQSFTREDINLQRFDSTNQGNLRANLQAAVLSAMFFPLVELIGQVATAIVLAAGGLAIIGGIKAGLTQGTLSIGVLVAFIGYVTRFFMPIRDLSQIYSLYQSAVVSTERVFEIMDRRPEVGDEPGAEPLPPIRGEVEFRDVTFAYDHGVPVLNHVSLVCHPGENIALVGPTGAGKSTVVNLLARFYDPGEGRVTIDGHDLRRVTMASLRGQIGMVLQETFIFSGTVRDNIRYGRPGATDEEVVAAAKVVNAHEFIINLPAGYDTQVQERGAKLSTGQRQLIAFARALIADPKILVLDEATSSVDAYTELLIQRALEKLLKGRTAFIIAHRLSTIRNADRIYVIDDGQVVEEGTHEDLLARGGRYRELYEKQYAAQEEGGDSGVGGGPT
ncbi:MAG TPA: ABC transporter ATP-binding protein [Bacillota bacterium]|jgi:ATP-binding cassette subfamily B protein